MRAFTFALVVVIVAALEVVLVAPSPASAATSVSYTTEVSGTSAPARATAQGWATNFRAAVSAAGGSASSYITFNQPTYSAGSAVNGVIHTTADGVSVSVKRSQYSGAASPVFVADSPVGNAGTSECTTAGSSLQGGAPRPTDLVDAPTCASTVSGVGGFAYSEVSGVGENTTRDALEFTFGAPVLAFGAWFGDLETRTVDGGLPAVVRLYGAAGTLLAEQQIVPSTANQSLCGGSYTGCGNNQTRFIDFVADPAQPVSRMVVIVGDDETTVVANQLNEGIGFIGAMVATMPRLAVTASVAAGYPINLGTGDYDIRYTITVSNVGGSAISTVGLQDDLAATFAPVSGAHVLLQSASLSPPGLAGSGATLNPAYDGKTVTQLLATTSHLAPTDSLTVTLTVRVTPGSTLGPFTNAVTASGSAGTTPVTASGVAPSVTFTEAPAIAATKSIVSAVSNGDGTQTIAYAVAVTNSGDVRLSALGVTDSLATAFGAQLQSTTAPTLTTPPVSGGIAANPAFTGDAEPNLISAGASLGAGESFTVTFSATIAAASATPGTNAASVSAVSPAGAPVTASSSVPVSFTFTGDVTITTIVTGAPGPVAETFTYPLVCPTVSPTASVVVTNATASASVVGIPALSTCAISSGPLPAAPAGYSWGAPAFSATSVSIIDGHVSQITVTHPLVRDTGSVQFVAAVTGGPGGGFSGTLPFSLDCGASGTFSASVAIAASAGASLVSAIGAPASCTVAVGALPAPAVGYNWGTPTVTPTTVAVTTGTPLVVSFSVALVLDTGTLTVTKVITGGPNDGSTRAFAFSVDCGSGGTFSTTANVTLAGAKTGSASVTGIPSAAVCTVVQTATPAAPAGFAWGSASYTGNPASIPSAAATSVLVSEPLTAVAALSSSGSRPLADTGAAIAAPAALALSSLFLGLGILIVVRRRETREKAC